MGPPGPAGAAASSAPLELTIVRASVAGVGLVRIGAYCETGIATGGGCRWGKAPGDVVAHESLPIVDDDGSTPIGWLCSGEAAATSSVDAFALCAP